MEGFRQSTDVGESHRSTGHLVTWSLLIRLRAGVLVLYHSVIMHHGFRTSGAGVEFSCIYVYILYMHSVRVGEWYSVV